MRLLGVVPARGGSKRLRRKNLLPLAGKPLVLHAAELLTQLCDRVVVSTDDGEIESVALSHGFEVHRRDRVDDSQTIREMVAPLVADLSWDGDVLLLQPTVPYPGDLAAFIETAEGMSAKGRVVDRRHRIGDPDLNQGISTGVWYWPAGTVGEEPVKWVDLPDTAGIDIDTVDDYRQAQLRANRKRILIEYVGGEQVGTGHQRRAETLAAALQHHQVFVTSNRRDPAETILDDMPVDMLITDRLDSADRPDVPLWVTFEDHGPAARQADLTINALYPSKRTEGYTWVGEGNTRSGPGWCVLRPEFLGLPPYVVREDVTRILVMFGGTDPADLHDLAWRAFDGEFPDATFTVIGPGDSVPVAATMQNHDLLVTSAGRTVYEAAAVGIPTVVLAQNNREATHVHLGPEHGNIYLGLGRLVTAGKLRHTVEQVAGDQALRQELSDTARRSVDGKGLDRIVWEIDRLLMGL